MEKIKASELFKSLIKNSQLAFISEDENYTKSMQKILGEKLSPEQIQLIDLIHVNNEFMRISLAKAVITTLNEYGFVNIDIDLSGITDTNPIVKQSTKEAVEKSAQA